jgi:hypothetical protein
VEGTIGTSGGQYCNNSGVCAARKGDGQSCATSNQCSGAGCYAARQCVNGCCDGSNTCHGYATGDKLCSSGRKCDDGIPCHTAGTVNTSKNPHTCTGFTNLANGSSCDPDTQTCTADACSSGSCVHAAGNIGVTCHMSSGECDTTTACSGSSTSCPSGLKANGTACTADTNPCTVDQCDGANATCQHPAGNAGAVCRGANGACDAAEICTGVSATCPADGVVAAGTVCLASTGPCDIGAACRGLTGYIQTLMLANPTGGGAQSNFQVLLQILADNASFWSHLDGGTSATGHDIHVQDAGGNELSFWIEQLDTASKRARIWVKVPIVAAAPSTATLKLLYGNASRAAASSIDGTMIFGDEFLGSGTGTSISGLDGNRWLVDDATGWAVNGGSGGHLTSTNVGGRIHSRTAVTTGMVIETKWKITANTDLAYVVVDGVKNTGSPNGEALVAGIDLDESTGQFNYWNNNLWTDTFLWSTNYNSAYVKSSIAVVATGGNRNASTLTLWSDGSNQRNLTFSQAYSPNAAALTLGKPYDDVSDRSGTYAADWDWALIRKYAATPPTLAANNDEAPDSASKACPPDTKRPDRTQCDDGDACTTPDACQAGVCTGPIVDTDGDGTPDCRDGCPLDPAKIAPGQCDCGVPDTDTDGDGIADCIDGCPTDPGKVVPGICGCGVADTDSNGDGSADCVATAGHNLFGPVFDKWKSLGWEMGFLGHPTTDTLPMPDGIGQFAHFEQGSIYWSPPAIAGYAIPTAVEKRWLAHGGASGFLGYPISDYQATADAKGAFAEFQGGVIYWSRNTQARELHGPIFARWQELGLHLSVLGFPTSDIKLTADEIGQYQKFEHGAIYLTPLSGGAFAAYEIHGNLYEYWGSLGWEQGRLGYPRSDVLALPAGGLWAHFQAGDIYWSECSGVTETPPDCSGGGQTVGGGGLGEACRTDNDCSTALHLSCYNPWSNAFGKCTATIEEYLPPATGRVDYDIGGQYDYGDHNACANTVLGGLAAMSLFAATQVDFDPKEGIGKSLPPDGHVVPDFDETFDHTEGLGRLSGAYDNWIAAPISHRESPFSHGTTGVFFVRVGETPGHDGGKFSAGRLSDTSKNVNSAYYELDSEHPNGMSILGRTLVVVSEPPSKEEIWFIDVSDPAGKSLTAATYHVVDLKTLSYPEGVSPPDQLSGVAIVRLNSGGYLMAVSRKGDENPAQIYLYLTDSPSLRSGSVRWYFHNHITAYSGGGPENISLVTQCDGTVYLLMGNNRACDDTILNVCNPNAQVNDEQNLITVHRLIKIGNKLALEDPPTGEAHGFVNAEYAFFRAAANFYVSPEGELLLYASGRGSTFGGSNYRLAEFGEPSFCGFGCPLSVY